MNTITLSKSEMVDAIEIGEVIFEEKHHRHNAEYITIVFLHTDSKYYQVTYFRDENDGIQWNDSYEATEVKQVEVVVKKWVPV
jgi:hypothetical protein